MKETKETKETKESKIHTLKVYDATKIPDMVGLHNTGVICYFNSLMQALLSCSSFNSYVLDHKDEFDALAHSDDKNAVGKIYGELLAGITSNKEKKEPKELKDQVLKKLNIVTVAPLLKELISVRRNMGTFDNLYHDRQEGVHDGLTQFLDTMGGDIDSLFKVRYKMEITCHSCKTTHAGPEEPPCYMIHLFESDPLLQDSLTTKASVESYIMRHYIPTDGDYKCNTCKAQNKYLEGQLVECNNMQVYKLARLSEIIILVFQQYFEKKETYFPPTLDFKSNNGMLHYKVVAQIEHFGVNRHSGHYTARCMRNKPAGFDNHRSNQFNEVIKRNIEKLTRQKNSKNDGKIIDEEIARLKEMRLDPVPDEDVVFLFNDSNVRYESGGFKPSKNTYMVFYHLFES